MDDKKAVEDMSIDELMFEMIALAMSQGSQDIAKLFARNLPVNWTDTSPQITERIKTLCNEIRRRVSE